MVFKWCLNKSNEHLPPDRINISIANIPHEFKILTQPLLSGLTGWKAGWKAGWLACYSAVMADDRGSQVKVKAHDWLFCFSCKNLFCFVTKHDLCYFLNTIFVWSKFSSTDFHTKLSKYWMSRLAKPPLKLLSLLRFWRQNIGKDFSATHAKILPCHEKTWPLLFEWKKKSNHYSNLI